MIARCGSLFGPVSETVDETGQALRDIRPPEDLEDARMRAALGERLLGRTERITIGRFEIQRRVGSGGMGVVYAAYDPRLDRNIALKVLRSDADPSMGEQILDEARAAARIQHPNVVSVFDSGEDDGRVWIAMELIDGCTLRQWWKAEPRGWREISELFAQCARALAQAHRIDLVHRDFKPNNVLVETPATGRPVARVVDFGLAARGTEVAPRTGWAGTPAYMAPEQYEAEPVDGRADQFSFCVALYEALHRRLPFEAATLPAQREAVEEGRIQPVQRHVPRWLRRIILRGVRPDRDERFESMDEVVAAIEHGLGRRRRVLGVAAAGVVVASALTTAWTWTAAADPCAAVVDSAKEHWHEARRDEIRAWFGDSDSTHFEAVIDKWVGGWQAMRTEACLAADVHAQQSAHVRGLRDACLQRRIATLDGQLNALLDLEPTPAHAAQAVRAASELPALDGCADVDALLRETPVEGSPEHIAAVAEHGQVVARLIGRHQLLPLKKAEPLVAAAVEEARRLGHPPLIARALWLEATTLEELAKHEEAAASVRASYLASIAGRADRAAFNAASKAAFIHLRGTMRFEEAERWLDRSDAWLTAMGDPPLGRAFWRDYNGLLALQRGKPAEAVEHYSAALALRRDTPQLVDSTYTSLNGLAAAEDMRGNSQAAFDRFEESLDAVSRVLGPNHPDAGRLLNNLGMISERLGKLDEARDFLERALAIKRATLGPQHPAVASTLTNLSNVAWGRGEREETRRLLVESLEIREQAYGSEHPSLVSTLINLSLTLAELGRHAEAETYIARAVGIAQLSYDSNHPSLLSARVAWAQSKFAQSDFEGARQLLEQAAEDTRDAELRPLDRAELNYELARTLAALDRGDPRVPELARAALAGCPADGEPFTCADAEALASERG